MVGKLFTKQIVVGVASALGFSGSVYLVIKQTVPQNTSNTITKVVVTPDSGMDAYTPAAAIVKKIDLGVLDTIFQLLNKMQEGGVVPTFKQLVEKMKKLPLLQKLMEECAVLGNGSDVTANVCKFKTKKEGEEFLAMFLNHVEHIEKVLKDDEKDLQQEKQTNPDTKRQPITILEIIQKLMTANTINSSKNKIPATKAFLEELLKTHTTMDDETKKMVQELIAHYTAELAKYPVADPSTP